MRLCTCLAGSHLQRSDEPDGEQPVDPMLLSVVLVVGEGSVALEHAFTRLSSVLSSLPPSLVAGHEVIVVAQGLDEEAGVVLQRVEAISSDVRVFLLTQAVDPFTAAWRGIENARGNHVAVVDSATDDIGFLPELLRRTTAGAEIVF